MNKYVGKIKKFILKFYVYFIKKKTMFTKLVVGWTVTIY